MRDRIEAQNEILAHQKRLIEQLETRVSPSKREEEEVPDVAVEDEDLFRGKHLKAFEKKIEKKFKRDPNEIIQIIEQYERAKEVKKATSAPDYLELVQKYATEIERYFPSIARRLGNNDPEAPLIAYELIKGSKFYHDDLQKSVPKAAPSANKKTLSEKLSEPESGMVGGTSNFKQAAQTWQNMPIGADLWAEFQRKTGFRG